MFVFLLLAGCGPSPTSPPSDNPVSDASASDAAASDSYAADSHAGEDSAAVDSAPADAPPPDGSTGLPGCLGEGRPLVVSSTLPFSLASVGSAGGHFLVDFGTTRSTIDLGAFSTPPSPSGCDPTLLGQSCTFYGFDFFGSWGTVTLTTADHSGVSASVRQAGILGTDFLSVHAFTLDYAGGRIGRAAKSTFCSDAAMTAAGFVALSSAGFYATDPSTLAPLSKVVEGAAASLHVPNVPTVPLRAFGVTAFAQLDTGFDDALVKHSINVNEAFYAAVAAKSPTALVRAPEKDLWLSTCVSGVSEGVEAYTLSGGAAELIDVSGSTARAYAGAVLFVKRTPPAAKVCGGIGTWTAPAAQLAGSFFVDAKVLVFDPFGSRVWVRPGS
ncbi:MAG: hypothetical protein HYV09_16680 [Deltaproteobacteria bacterium]|nr:hypothetical protein [Deltaproteobacteria bacterium]